MSHSTDEPSVAFYVSRILAPIVLFLVTYLAGICPILLMRPSKKGEDSASEQPASGLKERAEPGQIRSDGTPSSKTISFTACLGGGVLFAVALLHIIPEARAGFEKWDHLSEKDHNESQHHNASTHHSDDDDHDHRSIPMTELVVCLGFLAVYLIDELLNACLGHKHHSNEDHGHSHSPQVIQCATNGEQANNVEPHTHFSVFDQMEGGHSHEKQNEKKASGGGLPGIMAGAALSFHSVFEGLSLGLKEDAPNTWLMLFGIAMHKVVISFVLSFDLCAKGSKKSYVLIFIMIFSLMSPLGALFGYLAKSMLTQRVLVEAVLNGVAAGTLLFVCFCEVLQKEKNSSLHGLVQFLAVILGFGLIFGLGRVVALLNKPH